MKLDVSHAPLLPLSLDRFPPNFPRIRIHVVSGDIWFHISEKFPLRDLISRKTLFLRYFRVHWLCSAYGSREMFCDAYTLSQLWYRLNVAKRSTWEQCIYWGPTTDRRPTDLAFWKTSNGHMSATGHPIHFMFGSRVGFSGTADRELHSSFGGIQEKIMREE